MCSFSIHSSSVYFVFYLYVVSVIPKNLKGVESKKSENPSFLQTTLVRIGGSVVQFSKMTLAHAKSD